MSSRKTAAATCLPLRGCRSKRSKPSYRQPHRHNPAINRTHHNQCKNVTLYSARKQTKTSSQAYILTTRKLPPASCAMTLCVWLKPIRCKRVIEYTRVIEAFRCCFGVLSLEPRASDAGAAGALASQGFRTGGSSCVIVCDRV